MSATVQIFRPDAQTKAAPAVPQPTGFASVPMETQRLRRTGGRPIVFKGALIGHANNHMPGPDYWHEINLYLTEQNGFVIDLRTYSKAEGAQDYFHVLQAGAWDELLDLLESHDPRGDLSPAFNALDSGAPAAELMLRALVVKSDLEDCVSRFRAMIGRFLYEIGQ